MDIFSKEAFGNDFMAAHKALREQEALQRAWDELQDVPSYVDNNIATFAYECNAFLSQVSDLREDACD
jgi:hypothetical protein